MTKKIRFVINYQKFVLKEEIKNKLPKRIVRIHITHDNKKPV